MARKIVAEHWRNRARGNAIDLGVTSAHDLSPSPSSAMGKEQEERLLVEALRRIPLDFQIAIELYYVEGLKTREVAEVLDIPHATVRTRLHRGLEQVRQWVETLTEFPDGDSITRSRLDAWAADLRSKQD